MVAGHLQEKKGLYYIVLSYVDEFENRKIKWIPTGLPTKGNKKRAEAMLMEQRRTFDPENKAVDGDILFADYMEKWLEIIKSSIQKTTYSSYSNMVNLIKPEYVTAAFPTFLKYNGLRKIRYHDLRHPYVKPATKKYLKSTRSFRRIFSPKVLVLI